MTARRSSALLGVLFVLLAVTIVELPRTPAQSQAAPGFSQSRSIARTHLVGGSDVDAESRTFSLTVDQTTDLRGYQEINVAWSGAHPTGGVVADQNAGTAAQEEYPVVLLECAGVDDPSPTNAHPLDPTTCWTATSGERYQDAFNTAFPPWRLDRYASPDERTAIVNEPETRPPACFGRAPAEHWVPFRAHDGTVYAGGSGGCAGMAPEAANVGGLALPSNTTYAVTGANGTGSAKFDVWTSENNASLGCSDTVPCALVAVPILGVSCDAAGSALPPADRPAAGAIADQAEQLCTATGRFAPGQVVNPNGTEDLAVSGALWWSASNWRNRVTVPLSFAPASNVCDVVGAGDRVEVYGSELMTQAAQQWAPKFCLDPTLFRFKHVQTGEPEARTLLGSGTVDAAFGSTVPAGGWTKPIANAPVALTGFAIAFSIDDANGQSVTTLRLTPRLLAKLLSQSYPAINAIKEEYAALAPNPLNITLDPEFIALNPGITQGVPASESAAALLAVSSGSDVMNALTSYINADPDARAWLDGSPDPWGMVVNPSYKGISLPVATWPLLDSFEPPLLYGSDTNDCLFHNPVPYLPLVAAPIARLGPIAQNLQFGLANAQTVCHQVAEGVSDGEKLVAVGRQTPGYRFMLGVVALGDVHRYGLDAASLQSTVAPTAPAAFTSADGRTFVAPTDDSMRQAGALLVADPATNTWPVSYAALRTNPSAYPGTMAVYAQVPVAGVPNATAAELSQLLTFIATDGQSPGPGIGQLPPGYLPLTAENGLAGLADYTIRVAAAVKAQTGEVPTIEPVSSAESPREGVTAADHGDATTGPTGRSATSARRAAGSTDVVAVAAPVATGSAAVDGTTIAAESRLGGALVPALLALSGVAAIAALTMSAIGRRRARP